ncbi:crossover junction endonuclease EME1 [Cryptococcus neoformans AD2-60a]|nr:crossover junction endonuclease EME1 [Cryptococcus neoformans var. grubii AD2-60a]
MPTEVVVISDDESDQEIHLVPTKPIFSHSQPALIPASTAIVIDSDSEDGIETDDDDDGDDSGEDQDILGLLSQMADDSGLRMATTTATVGRTQSTSVLETCRARTDIVERGLSKGRALGESRTFAGSILSQVDSLDKTPTPRTTFAPTEKSKKRTASSGDDNGVQKRSKTNDDTSGLTRQEMAAIKASEREAKAAQKAKEKEARQFERDTAKAAKEAERSYQRKVAQVNKLRTSKQDTLREIHLYLSADMSLPSSPIAGALPELRNRIQDCQSALHFLPEPDSPIPGVIRFKRHLQARWDPESKRFVPLDDPRWVWEKTVLVLITAEELVDKIADADVGGREDADADADVDVLAQWASDVRLLLGLAMSDQVVLMIKGLQKYYSKSRSLANKDYINAARAGLDGGSATATTTTAAVNGRYGPPRPTRDQIEAEMVRLQVAEHFFLVHVEKTEDVEDWVYNIAADIALRPYKLVSKSHLNFAPAEGTRKALQPTAVLELMLQEVQGITASAAAGITEKYPTFRRLMEAFEMEEQRGGMERAEMMLQYCEVRNLKSGHASGRNLNKALSKRVYNAFRGTDSLSLA